jgi:hypothetical protein
MRARRLLAAVLWLAPALVWGSEGSPPARELRFAGGTIRIAATATLTPPAPDWFAPESGRAFEESPRGRVYLLALFNGGLSGPDSEALRAAGVEILDYVPVHGYRLRVPPPAEHAVRGMASVVWLGNAPAHLKVAPELLRRATLVVPAAPAGAPERIALRIVLAGDEPPGRALEILRGLEVVPAPPGKDGAWRIAASVPVARLRGILARLAALPEVEAIEPKRALLPFNQDAVWVHQSFVGPSPQATPIFDRGIFGCGQVVTNLRACPRRITL